ncbi:unnamed protein product, partial [Candidula unifasciata]
DTTDSKRGSPNIKMIMDVNPRPEDARNLTFSACEYTACAMTSNPLEADLLMFNGLRMEGLTLPQRPTGQIWLMYTREPPSARKVQDLKRIDLRNQFNWSRTVLGDSTFQIVYGVIGERTAPVKDYGAIFQRKKHVVAWFVSKCRTFSKREDYVRRLSSYVSVHVYGLCGNRTCGSRGYEMGGSKTKCLEMISKSYKFYLSFENSFCRDYITEKFFAMFSDVDVIPVVRGGGDYRKLFPPGIFINSDDFPSPESLGKYLNALARDKSAYIRMLQNKNRYTLTSGTYFSCNLCKALHLQSPQNVYEDIYSWMLRPNNCWSPTDLPDIQN